MKTDTFFPINEREAAFRAGWTQATNGKWWRVPRAGESHDPQTAILCGRYVVWEPSAIAACERDGLQYARRPKPMRRYAITRIYKDPNKPNRRIKFVATMAEAEAHCQSAEASSETATSISARERTLLHGAWFDAFDGKP